MGEDAIKGECAVAADGEGQRLHVASLPLRPAGPDEFGRTGDVPAGILRFGPDGMGPRQSRMGKGEAGIGLHGPAQRRHDARPGREEEVDAVAVQRRRLAGAGGDGQAAAIHMGHDRSPGAGVARGSLDAPFGGSHQRQWRRPVIPRHRGPAERGVPIVGI